MEAIQCLHAAGYDTITNITLALRLDRLTGFRAGPELHDRHFRS